MSLSESTVYRNVYSNMQSTSYQPAWSKQRRAGLSASADSTNEWSFLQRLLAIEEAHDRKRKAKEKQRDADQEYERRNRIKEDNQRNSPHTDMLSRWMHSQVLDDNPDDVNNSTDDDDENQLDDPQVNLYDESSQRIPSPQSTIPALPPLTETSRNFLAEEDEQSSCSQHTYPPSPSLSRLPTRQKDDSNKPRRKRQLRLPPILLPRIYSVAPRPLQYREFLTPTKVRGPITDTEWEDLKDCRYIRHAVPRFALQVSSSNMSSLQF